MILSISRHALDKTTLMFYIKFKHNEETFFIRHKSDKNWAGGVFEKYVGRTGWVRFDDNDIEFFGEFPEMRFFVEYIFAGVISNG